MRAWRFLRAWISSAHLTPTLSWKVWNEREHKREQYKIDTRLRRGLR
jgi:hypothetical protein